MNNGRARLLNVLTIVVLVATMCLVGLYGLVAVGVYNPLPPPTRMTPAQLPTSTPTPKVTAIPTWTPTHTASPAPPTNTATPKPPTPTPSITSTFPPSMTPPPTATTTPTATLKPTVTRSPWPFTYESSFEPGKYGGCGWSGVAGHVQNLDGEPLKGYLVHVWGAGIDEVVVAGANERFNTIYGSEAAWEQFFAPSAKVMEVHVQLHDPYSADHPPVSEEIVLNFPGYCGGALGYVTFTQNH